MKKIISLNLVTPKTRYNQYKINDRKQGGSPAKILILEDPKTTKKIAIKYSDSPEKNGREHLEQEYRFRESIKKTPLERLFASVYDGGVLSTEEAIDLGWKERIEGEANNHYETQPLGFYMAQEFIGMNLKECVQKKLMDTETFKSKYKELFREMWTKGYCNQPDKVVNLTTDQTNCRWQSYYIDRFTNRMDALGEKLQRQSRYQPEVSPEPKDTKKHRFCFDQLRQMKAFEIKANSEGADIKTVPNILHFMPNLLQNDALNKDWKPRIKTAIAHQDTNPENICWDSESKDSRFKLIDCHGVGTGKPDDPDSWQNSQEPAYDIGKLMFGFDGFSNILHGEYDLTEEGGNRFTYEVTPELSLKSYRDSVLSCLNNGSDPADPFQQLKNKEPNLESRVKFICVFQYLCDLIYREDPTTIQAQVLQASLTFQEFFPGVIDALRSA